MKPNTVSATSLESFLGCPRRYAAEQEARVSVDSEPGRFGTTLHAALDRYIEVLYPDGKPQSGFEGRHDLTLLLSLWEEEAQARLDYGSDYVPEGRDLLTRWVETRTLPHEVLEREQKQTFDLTLADGTVQAVTWIIDRLDRLEDGRFEIIDYKSQYLRVNPDAMRKLIQPALYASAIRRKFGAQEVIVTYDLLRYGTTSIVLGPRDIDAFDAYLLSIVERIHATEAEDAKEKLNKNCRYCPRKGVCETLLQAESIGWAPALPVEQLAQMHDDLKNAGKGIEALLAEIDAALLAEVSKSEDGTADAGAFTLGATTATRTTYNAEVLLRTVGPEATAFLSVGKSALDKELVRKKGNRFTDEQIAAIRAAAITTHGDPKVTVTAKNPMDAE